MRTAPQPQGAHRQHPHPGRPQQRRAGAGDEQKAGGCQHPQQRPDSSGEPGADPQAAAHQQPHVQARERHQVRQPRGAQTAAPAVRQPRGVTQRQGPGKADAGTRAGPLHDRVDAAPDRPPEAPSHVPPRRSSGFEEAPRLQPHPPGSGGQGRLIGEARSPPQEPSDP